jgi:TolB protein
VKQISGRVTRAMKWRSQVWIVVLAASMLAACASTGSPAVHGASGSPAAPTSTTAKQAAAHGVEAAITDVPWSQVGPGWTLATWSPVPGAHPGAPPSPGEPTHETATTTLYLVNPAGGRYAITTFPPPGDGPSPMLVDWSGDGSRALFYAPGSSTAVIEVDLHSGKQTTVAVDHFDITPRYSRPDGKALLLVKSNDVHSPASLERVDLAGNHQLTYPVQKLGSTFNADYLSTPDGLRLVLGTASGLAVMGNDGTLGKTLPIPGERDCTPTRWWDTGSAIVVARCHGPNYDYSRLWLVPIDGGTPTTLSAANTGQDGPDLGDETAWQLPSGTFVQAEGPCGHKFLAKLNADGTTSQVSVPNVDSRRSVVVVGANGGDLTLQASVSCGTGESLLDYNPASSTSTVLLGPTVNGGGVIGAVPYSGRE